ncbi:MAG: GNAT family N-acetyltransferase [Thermomicrobiales bacterium]|nr:GNAT family N-acetyltransferase [Thermomicrobiales bacterium]
MLEMVAAGAGREAFLDLLLLADESELQVRSYLNAGDLYVWRRGGDAVGIVLAIPDGDAVELKAVAVAPAWQGRGVGSAMLRAVLDDLRGRGVRRVTVGTGNSGVGQLAFYQKVGFRLASIERDFFSPARGYPADLEENGIPLRDMVWMDLEL